MAEKEKKKAEVRRDLPADGKPNLYSDAFESHSDFQDEIEDMNDEFFKKNNPEYYKLLQQMKGKNADEEPNSEDSGDHS